jgi:hypothetical protein
MRVASPPFLASEAGLTPFLWKKASGSVFSSGRVCSFAHATTQAKPRADGGRVAESLCRHVRGRLFSRAAHQRVMLTMLSD